jgi:putative membrane protein
MQNKREALIMTDPGIVARAFSLAYKIIVMKKLTRFYYVYYLSAVFLLLLSCTNGSTDSVKDAKKENREKIDSQVDKQQHIDSIAALPSKEDADFVVNASSGGMLEVQLGKLAQTNSRSQHVKKFGAMMIKDHGEGGKKLKMLAASKNITLPDSISNQQQKEKERLLQKKGAAFDEAYINMMVDDHKKDIREFEQEATNGTNEAIKAFARDNLRMLHIHLDSATNVQKMISKKTPVVPAYPTPLY